jgi:hypothetical protein
VCKNIKTIYHFNTNQNIFLLKDPAGLALYINRRRVQKPQEVVNQNTKREEKAIQVLIKHMIQNISELCGLYIWESFRFKYAVV